MKFFTKGILFLLEETTAGYCKHLNLYPGTEHVNILAVQMRFQICNDMSMAVPVAARSKA